MSNPFQRIRDFIARQFSQNGNDYELDGAYGALHPGGDSQRQLYTALDIGTAYAKALIIEVQDDVGVVLGVGRNAQSYTHMSDGIVIELPLTNSPAIPMTAEGATTPPAAFSALIRASLQLAITPDMSVTIPSDIWA